ncbi:MAG: hypothetical protein IPK17_29660 [Chloroflexi bacterium]|uniref:glycoside hydrolase family 38 N-terminal domain-containing protein n=1 Tax=Candidatus Flexifilum breve TaxID=3140694 RepID=UPI003136D0E6|nr:hypothetical protein [Chloroflexota bacterium]
MNEPSTAQTNERTLLYYTFGNHMHWVDMEWLWGYQVLPDSLRDMLHFCRETGAKGNINFDGIGYEKMAVEAPDALQELRAALQAGTLEVVGASYGQPYGLFHGGESNVRQRVYGVRSVMRLLGVRPKTFWEEEFDFFPQLPQMLRGVGFEYASLFFQWTWHTPEVPRETIPAVWWEGMDGSRLLTSTRNALNLHQWPEDFAGLLDSPIIHEMPVPGIVQWLELMPSPDWMCRSELLLPQLHALKADPRFELRFVTLSEYLDQARAHAQPRRYTLDDVFHGMSLGKNGDYFRRLSRKTEEALLTAESLSALAGLFGRPYPHWDVYPTWELEEGWRELLSAQHHDNDECEGLCGFVGENSYQRSRRLSEAIFQRSQSLLIERIGLAHEQTFAYNPLGWERRFVRMTGNNYQLTTVPPFGYTVCHDELVLPFPDFDETASEFIVRRGALTVIVDKQRGLITQIANADFPDGVLEKPLLLLEMTHGGQVERFESADVSISGDSIFIFRHGAGITLRFVLTLYPLEEAIDIECKSMPTIPRPDNGVAAALKMHLALRLPEGRLIHDHPYGMSEITAQGKIYKRKYPTGEWMTSPQVFEDVHNPFTALSLLDFMGDKRGVLLLHDGSQAFLRCDTSAGVLHVVNILSLYDAWDEDYFVDTLDLGFRLILHGELDHVQRWKLAQEFRRPLEWVTNFRKDQHPVLDQQLANKPPLPPTFSPVQCESASVVVTAFYRESEAIAKDLPDYAGSGMGFPYILRLVEFNGVEAPVTLRVAGNVGAAYKTNLLGEISEPVTFTLSEDQLTSTCQLTLKPHEIATLYLDLEWGRKQPRNLDEHRSVWATVHRVDEQQEKPE